MSNDHPDSHYQLLRQAIPAWLGQATPAKHAALAQAKPRPLTATADQRAELLRLNGEHWRAQTRVDAALKNLQEPTAFARPILEAALLARFGLTLNTETTFLRLYIPLSVPWFPIPSGAAHTRTLSLVDAALQNFEQGETLPGAFEPSSTYTSEPSAGSRFDTLPHLEQALPIAAFATLCRELDIGARYQQYLRAQLGIGDPVATAVLQHKVSASQQAALRTALHLARTQGDIQADFAAVIEALLAGESAPILDYQAVGCHDLSMMDVPLTGIMLFAADLEHVRSVQRIVAYIPDDPQHPLKEYASALTFKQALAQQLRDSEYQAFFSRFVAHDKRGVFFAGLSQRLARVIWHTPVPGSQLAPWRKAPTDDPKLQFVATLIRGDLWVQRYQQALNKVLNDGRSLALSTADVDRTARWKRWDALVDVASSVLNTALLVVTPLIPGLGELMLGYMAYQLLDDVFEGIVDWAEGVSDEAFGHLMSVLQSLVQLGAFGAGASIGAAELRKVLPQSVLSFVDRLKPVTLANGNRRYWQPDLAPYEQTLALPPRLGATPSGLQRVRSESILPLEGKLYAVQKKPDGRYVIKHPTRPDAYTPQLHHNQESAWHTELEDPLTWDKPTLLRRLGAHAEALGESDRELALSLSNVPENALRKMHHNNERVPPLLGDAMARVHIERQIQTLIERLESDDPALHRQIDPQDLLQLLVSYGAWPKTRGLRFLNTEGRTTWEFGEPNQPIVQIHEAQLGNGDLLKTVLQTLSPEEIRTQFGERPSDPQLSLDTRAKHLRKRLARIADTHRTQLFDSRYADWQTSAEIPVQQLQQAAPGLPASVVARLIDHASGAELQALEQRRTPPRLADLAQEALQTLRINRAYEGQHLTGVSNADSDRLALNSLKIQPGWSDQIQLDVRENSMQGPLWLQIGPDDAPLRRTLIRHDNGRYVAHDDKAPLAGETDLYSAILAALPDAERQALNIDIHQGAELRLRLRQPPLPRDQLREVLGITPPAQTPTDTLRLLGNVEGYPMQTQGPTRPLSHYERARLLFPGIDNRQIQDLLDHLQTQPGGVSHGIAALAEEYHRLDRDLNDWQYDTPQPTDSGEPSVSHYRYERHNRRLVAEQIKRCWRRETDLDSYYDDPARDGHVLRLEAPINGVLPTLTANFDHVTLLTLNGGPATTGAEAFLSRFARLRHLEVTGINFGDLPPSLNQMPRLNTLGLAHCNITLNAASHARLASMNRLQSLVLNNNPLGQVPSVENMPGLVVLDLADTGIDQLPPGLFTRPELQAALLGGNQLRELPPALFALNAEDSRRFDLSDNPLSRATLEQVKAYYQRYGTHWEADAQTVDIRDARLLYPSLDREAINRLIFALPGDIEAGKIELARLAGELNTLRQSLGQWQQASTPTPPEYARRTALCHLLERSWRREIEQDTPHIHALNIPRHLAGELPSTSASFGHINSLIIEGNGTAIDPGGFLRSFPALEILDIEGTPLGDVPASVFSLPALTFIGLPRCSITLSAASRGALEGLTQLHYLDLSHNPLGAPPDFTRLTRLTSLTLRDTGLTQVPNGLLTPERRGSINLSHNAIEQLPDITFSLPVSATSAFDLSANPLSRTTLDKVKRYCQLTHEHLNASAPHAERARLQRLFPTFVDGELDRFLFKLPGDMDALPGALGQLEAEYHQLTTDLQQWVLDVPADHPILGVPLDENTRALQQLTRRRFKSLMEQAWRRECAEDEESLDEEFSHSVVLETPIMGPLPALNARFEHVSSFELQGDGTTTQVDGTLRCFANLQTLKLNRCALGTLPTALFSMGKLTNLELAQCAIRLTPETARNMADLHTLEFLDMSQNPLGHAPDLSTMSNLTSLHLNAAGLQQVPNGLFALENLMTVDLSHNQLREMPAALLEMIPELLDDSDLSNNPWSAQSLSYLRAYFQRTGIDFQVLQAGVDDQGNPLSQPLSHGQEE